MCLFHLHFAFSVVVVFYCFYISSVWFRLSLVGFVVMKGYDVICFYLLLMEYYRLIFRAACFNIVVKQF